MWTGRQRRYANHPLAEKNKLQDKDLPHTQVAVPLYHFKYRQWEIQIDFVYLPGYKSPPSPRPIISPLPKAVDRAFIRVTLEKGYSRLCHHYPITSFYDMCKFIQADKENTMDPHLMKFVKSRRIELLMHPEDDDFADLPLDEQNERNRRADEIRAHLLEKIKHSCKPYLMHESRFVDQKKSSDGKPVPCSWARLYYTPYRRQDNQPNERKWTVSITQYTEVPSAATDIRYTPSANSPDRICLTTEKFYDIMIVCNKAIDHWLSGMPMAEFKP